VDLYSIFVANTPLMRTMYLCVRELNVCTNGQHLTREPHSVYLSVTLDRTLSYL